METKQFKATFEVPAEIIDNIVAEITNRVMGKMSDTLRTISELLVDEVSSVKTAVKTMVENKVTEAVKTITSNDDVPADVIEAAVEKEIAKSEPEPETEVQETVEADITPEPEAGVATEPEAGVTTEPDSELDKTTEPNIVVRHKREPKPPFDYSAIQKYCEDITAGVVAGTIQGNFNIEDETILKMSNGLVHAYLGKCRGFSPRFNFRNTKQVAIGYKFNGFLKNQRIASVLENAFKNYVPEKTASKSSVTDDEFHDCDTPVKERRRRRGTTFKNQSYAKVAGGSNMIKIRVRSNGTIAPMIIDREFGNDMIERHLTHVTLMNSKDGKDIYLVFTEQDQRTHAPNNSPNIARLSIYGRNRKNHEATTFTISSQKFQESIVKHFGFDMLPNKEFFINFTEGAQGIHKDATAIFKRFSGKKYCSIKLTSRK